VKRGGRELPLEREGIHASLAAEPLGGAAEVSGITLPSPSRAPPAPRPQDVYRSTLDATSRVGISGALVLAFALHVLVFGGAFLLPRLFPGTQKLRKPILAHMVALGKPRDAKLLPRKQDDPSAGASKTAPPAPVVVANAAPARPAPAPGNAPPARSVPAKRAPTRAELMAQALRSVRPGAQAQARAPDPDREGEATGSETGTAATAEVGDKYFSEVHDVIQQNYVVPSVISERERLFLNATIVVWIGRDGTVLKHRLEKSSGNTFFDNALETAIAHSKLPAPPPELARSLATDGVGINFKP
jgi:outer membrane biosynthesis protein TonB